jgi:hypothetical protein
MKKNKNKRKFINEDNADNDEELKNNWRKINANGRHPILRSKRNNGGALMNTK